jgi:hypothetical protein
MAGVSPIIGTEGCCVEQYRFNGDQERQHFMLWAGENDEVSGKSFYVLRA